jgi:hypothetical protein
VEDTAQDKTRTTQVKQSSPKGTGEGRFESFEVMQVI